MMMVVVVVKMKIMMMGRGNTCSVVLEVITNQGCVPVHTREACSKEAINTQIATYKAMQAVDQPD